ncbi:MAG: WG repeat-containing protein [Clostridia bacterium]
MANNKKHFRPHSNTNNRLPIEVKGDKEVLALPIEELGLYPDTLELLKKNNFVTIYDIAKHTERELFRVQTFNKKHLINVKAKIAEKGIELLPQPVYETSRDGAPKEGLDVAKVDSVEPIRPNQRENKSVINANAISKQDRANIKQPKVEQSRAEQKPRVDKRPEPKNTKFDPKLPKIDSRQLKPDVKQKVFEPKLPKVELPLEEWRKITKNGKWGFSNGLRTVIEPKFDEVFNFKEGLACVEVNELFGFINPSGEYVIEPMYDCAMSFSEGFAVIFEHEKCGYINKNNERVIDCKFDAATAFENGRAKVKESGKWGTIAPDGTTLWSK